MRSYCFCLRLYILFHIISIHLEQEHAIMGLPHKQAQISDFFKACNPIVKFEVTCHWYQYLNMYMQVNMLLVMKIYERIGECLYGTLRRGWVIYLFKFYVK